METSKNLTRQLTLDELIYLQEGSPANPTPSPESERGSRTSATCGQRCCALFENAPRATSWAKTFAALLVGMEGWSSKRCALTWKLKGTPYNRSYLALVGSALPTEEIASGLLLTPTTREEVMDTDKFKARMEKYNNGTTVPNLATQIHQMLPTPLARDWQGPVLAGKRLTKTGKMQNYGKQLPNIVEDLAGKGSQLSPLFVEEMMGFPKNWTALPFQSGDEKA